MIQPKTTFPHSHLGNPNVLYRNLLGSCTCSAIPSISLRCKALDKCNFILCCQKMKKHETRGGGGCPVYSFVGAAHRNQIPQTGVLYFWKAEMLIKHSY